MNQDITEKLMAYRITGDVALLLHIDKILQIIRKYLRYSYVEYIKGTHGDKTIPDNPNHARAYNPPTAMRGYLRLLLYREGTSNPVGTEHDLQCYPMAAVLAECAYAFINAGNIACPGYTRLVRDTQAKGTVWQGTTLAREPLPDLGVLGEKTLLERGKAWLWYLKENWEKSQQGRKGVGPNVYNYWATSLRHNLSHSHVSGVRYRYFMHKMTGVAGQLTEANRMCNDINGFHLIDAPGRSGKKAYVWGHKIAGSFHEKWTYLAQSTTYARYDANGFLSLKHEGFDYHRGNPTWMQEMARNLARFCIKATGTTLHMDVVSGIDRLLPNGQAMKASDYRPGVPDIVDFWASVAGADSTDRALIVQKMRAADNGRTIPMPVVEMMLNYPPAIDLV